MDFWHHVLSAIQKQTSRQCVDTWFRPVSYRGREKGILLLEVPSETFKARLMENYADLLQCAASEAAGCPLTLRISVDGASSSDASSATAGIRKQDPPPLLNDGYTFGSFVVGAGNQLAGAAALAVAERPAKAYNPLFLYGGVGLGKTHLVHAIGNHIQERNKSVRMAYISSERFMNDLVHAIQYERTMQFRQSYRDIDVLLMDDVQFLAGKERTQEEFFHTFNALYDAQKQIVITSDCPPKQIPTLEERMHSRFEWGLIAEIQPPDNETKLAILKKKAEAEEMSLPDDVAAYIADGIRSDMRQLEGALNLISIQASIDGLNVADIDVEYAKKVLKFCNDENHAISSEEVLRAVASYFSMKPAQLKARTNSPPVATPRQIAMYICKELTNKSLPQIGREFGGKHHTTVLHSVRKIETLKKKDPEISAAVDQIIKSIR